MRVHGILTSCGLLALATATPALAQSTSDQAVSGRDASTGMPPAGQAPLSSAVPASGIADIVVTATRTGATQAQRTPLAVSVFSSQALATSGISNVKDLATLTPSLTFSQTAANAQIYIRGIGSNNTYIGSDPSVTVHVDGVYLARSYSQVTDFIDIDRVEVLRGPQGTIYGRNAIGGTINIITRKPSDTFEGQVQLAGGNYGTFNAQGYASGPIVPGLIQASISGNYFSHNDYFPNAVRGVHGVGNANHGGVRGQVRITPSDRLELITRADWSKADERVISFSKPLAPFAAAPLATSLLDDDRRVALNTPQPITTRNWGVSEEINYKLTDSLSVKSLTAYRHSSYDLLVDIDATERNLIAGAQTDRSNVVTQEFDLNLAVARFKGVAGFFYYHENEDATLRINLYQPGLVRYVDPSVESRSYAGFVQGTYDLTDRLSIVAGVRYTNDRKSVDQRLTLQPAAAFPNGPNIPPFPFVASTGRTFDAYTPKFGINYQVTPHILAYASATKGFKSGGTNYAADRPATLSYGPEKLWAYEAGLKTDLFDRHLRFNASGFIYDYSDLQVQSLLSPGVTTISNAASARLKGVELETTAKPIPALTLTANYALLDSHYRNFRQASVPATLIPYVIGDPRYNAATATYDASGNRLNSAPRNAFTGTAQVEKKLGFATAYVRGEYSWQSRTYYDPTNVEIASQKAYHLVNLGAGLHNDAKGWAAQVIVRNLTNKDYILAVGTNGVVPAAQIGTPRTILFQISKKW